MREKKLHFIFYFFGVYVISVFLLLGLTVSVNIHTSLYFNGIFGKWIYNRNDRLISMETVKPSSKKTEITYTPKK
jgi:UDP-N-acetylglucosamine:LPS N-acetylglucosamine transferase